MTLGPNDIKVIDGQPFASAEIIALLVGVTVEEVTEETLRQAQAAGYASTFRFALPTLWQWRARAITDRYGTRNLDELVPLLRAERDLADP